MSPTADYHPRRNGALGTWHVDDFRVKAYGIKHAAGADHMLLPDVMVDAARSVVEASLQTVPPAGHLNAGFAIVHAGTEAIWPLLDWWQPGGILCQRMWRTKLDAPGAFHPVSQPPWHVYGNWWSSPMSVTHG